MNIILHNIKIVNNSLLRKKISNYQERWCSYKHSSLIIQRMKALAAVTLNKSWVGNRYYSSLRCRVVTKSVKNQKEKWLLLTKKEISLANSTYTFSKDKLINAAQTKAQDCCYLKVKDFGECLLEQRYGWRRHIIHSRWWSSVFLTTPLRYRMFIF